MKSESLFQYIDGYLAIDEHPDYPNAMNGLQVGGSIEVAHVCAAVDASVESIRAAAEEDADALLVHHGLFWSGLEPITGRRYRKISTLVRSDVALYSAHLPLDAHPEVGNSILLARAVGVTKEQPFGTYDDVRIGWSGTLEDTREGVRERLEDVVGGPVKVIAGGPETVERVGVVTGGGGSFVGEAADAGLDALITGEGSHHSYVEAVELGVNVFYAGHYATETFGVRALAEHLAERFGLTWSFLDFPSGL